MTTNDERFADLFDQLRAVMAAHASGLVLATDQPGDYSLNAPRSLRPKQDTFFGAVRAGKRYVSYHLMPLYTEPALLDEVPASLKKRMQGKSCFNFTAVDEETKAELGQLTRRGVELYREKGLT